MNQSTEFKYYQKNCKLDKWVKQDSKTTMRKKTDKCYSSKKWPNRSYKRVGVPPAVCGPYFLNNSECGPGPEIIIPGTDFVSV
jgi:hypothetical protein